MRRLLAGTSQVGRLSRRGAILASVVLWPASSVYAQGGIPLYDYEVVHVYPHDPHAFTEGLFYLNGYLYESTGLEKHSSIRKVRLETGEVLHKVDVPPQYFGEGIVDWKQHLLSLTWKSQIGFIRNLATFKVEGQFHYPGEGWALTQDGTHLIMSDGTPDLRFLDPISLEETGRLHVTVEGRPLPHINELEWVRGEIYANVWETNIIVRISPRSGDVIGVIDLGGLLPDADRVPGQTDVLNGIAYDERRDRLFVTGKNWPKLFEIRLKRRPAIPRPPPASSQHDR